MSSVVTQDLSFSGFALSCARSMFNAEELEEIPDAPISQDFLLSASSEYASLLQAAHKRLDELNAMTVADAKLLLSQADSQHDFQIAMREIAKKYDSLMAQVDQWAPPTENHMHFKEKMRHELAERRSSEEMHIETKFRRHVSHSSPEEFLLQARAMQVKYVARLEQKIESETRRINDGNLWLQQLRESLLTTDIQESLVA